MKIILFFLVCLVIGGDGLKTIHHPNVRNNVKADAINEAQAISTDNTPTNTSVSTSTTTTTITTSARPVRVTPRSRDLPPQMIMHNTPAKPSESSTDPPVRVLRAVRNHKAYLPCAPGKIFLDGPEASVIWLKNDEEVIHRFPNENTQQTYLDPNNMLGVSCPEKKCHDGTSLLLPEVTAKDEGQYRCRVHYEDLSSVDYVIDLKVVDAPGRPRIYGVNHTLVSSYVGPLELGSNLTLICEVVATEPPTTLVWLRDNIVIARVSTTKPGILQERVRIVNAKRSEHKRRYRCTSSNSDVTEPFAASVVIEMHLPPLSVEIRLNNKYEFEINQPRVVDCVIVGCVPMPTVDWYVNDTLLKSTLHKEIHDGNYTVSSLTFTPPSSYLNKHKLSCKVHNDNTTTTYGDDVRISIGFRPRCAWKTERKLSLVEGEAVTVTCVYEAAPGPMQYSWVFPDSRIINTFGEKIYSERNLFSTKLTWKPRQSDVGVLYCRAVNSFGIETVPCTYSLGRSMLDSSTCNVNDSIENPVLCPGGGDLPVEKSMDPGFSVILLTLGGVIFIFLFGFLLVCATRIRKEPSNIPAPIIDDNGCFHREPDFTRDERVLATTINVHQHSPCLNSCSPKSFHVMPLSPLTAVAQDTYYV